MKILVSYRGIPESPGWATGDMVVKAFRALGHEVFPYAQYYQRSYCVEPLVLAPDNIDLLLFTECNDGDSQYLELCRTTARHKACWFFDSSYMADQYRGLVDYFKFDHIFLANPLTIRQYKQWGYNNVHYLPYAADVELHGRPLEIPKVRDIALIGSVRDDRLKLKKELAGQGINLELIGGLFREQYVDALASSRMIVNQNPPQGRGLLNMRHFEAQAAGCMLLEQWNDLKVNMEEGLDVGGLVINYEYAGDIPGLYKDYIDMDQELIADLQQEFLAKHTYQNRCERILEVING